MSDRKWPGSEEAKAEIRQKSKSSNCHFHHGMDGAEPLFWVVSFITDRSAADAAADQVAVIRTERGVSLASSPNVKVSDNPKPPPRLTPSGESHSHH